MTAFFENNPFTISQIGKATVTPSSGFDIDLLDSSQNANCLNPLENPLNTHSTAISAGSDDFNFTHLLRPAHDAPVTQRLHAAPPFSHTSTYPGALPSSLSNRFPAPFVQCTDHSIVRQASDSAYSSLNITSGPLRSPSAVVEPYTFTGPAPRFSLPTAPFSVVNCTQPPESVVSEPRVARKSFAQAPHRPARTRSKSNVTLCTDCGKRLKNRSDAQKHELQHTKPFKCTEPDCTRMEGFATQNDLQRHRSSVHNRRPTVGRQNGYICVVCSQSASGKPKFWPRRDNFKAHVERRHKDYDWSYVMSQSECQRPDDVLSEYGYPPSAASIMDEYACRRLELASTGIPELPESKSQNHDLVFGLGGNYDPLAGVGVGADRITATPIEHSDFAFTSASSGLSRVSSAAATMDDLTSPATTASLTSDDVSLLHRSTIEHPVVETSTYPLNYLNADSSLPTTFTLATPPDVSPLNEAEGTFICRWCSKRRKRECDLRKHMKRHTRPYGCTFPTCNKRFGSRNDWKRHEAAQHRISDAWRCVLSLPRHPDQCCSEYMRSESDFRAHLQQIHHLPAPELDKACDQMHLGKNATANFWCGFCPNPIVKVGMEVPKPLENRAKHIGDHYDKDQFEIGDWICEERGRKRKETSEFSGRGWGKDEEADLDMEMEIASMEWDAGEVEGKGTLDRFGIGPFVPPPKKMMSRMGSGVNAEVYVKMLKGSAQQSEEMDFQGMALSDPGWKGLAWQ